MTNETGTKLEEIRITLEKAIQSHLECLRYGSKKDRRTRLKYIKTIESFHSDLNMEVTIKYLKWLWSEIINGKRGVSFGEFENK